MKNLWKWVLGIVLVLVVAGALFGLGFFVRTRVMADGMPRNIEVLQARPGGPLRGDRVIMPHGGPMVMREFGHGPFRPGRMFFGFFGRLLPLAVLGLLLFGAYQLGKRRSAPVVVPTTLAAAPPVAAPTTHPCPACESPVQDGWKHCPNCGTAQA